MKTLKTYLAAVALDADATAAVYYDTVESYTNESATESTDQTWSATPAAATKILVKKAETTAATGGTKGKIGYKIPDPAANDQVQLYVAGQGLFASSSAQTYLSATLVLSGNATIDVSRIKDAVHLTNATANDVTLDAYVGGNDAITISFISHSALPGFGSRFISGERYTTAAALSGAASYADIATMGATRGGIGTDDIVTLTVGSNSVTAVVAHATNAAVTGSASIIAAALATAWTAKYGAAGTSSLTAVADVAHAGAGAAENILTITGLDPGTRGSGIAVSFSVANSTTGPTSITADANLVDYMVGLTRSTADNSSVSDDIIVTLESNVAGTILNKVKTNLTAAAVGNYGVSYAGFAPTTLLASAYTVNTADIQAYSRSKQIESRSDVRPAEAGTPGSGDAQNYSRVHWLAD
jgi:hypothetical protein